MIQESLVHEELSLSSVVEISLERALVSRFLDRIVACLKKPTKYAVQPSSLSHDLRVLSCCEWACQRTHTYASRREEEMHLKRKVAAASTKPQSFFGISVRPLYLSFRAFSLHALTSSSGKHSRHRRSTPRRADGRTPLPSCRL